MVRLLCILTILGLGQAKYTPGLNDALSKNNAMKKVCLPKQYQTWAMEHVYVSSPPSFTSLLLQLAMNYDKKMMGIKIYNTDPFIMIQRMVQDFTKGVQYSIIGDKCNTSKILVPLVGPCLPDDAEYLGDSYSGVPPHNLAAHTWKLKLEGMQVDFSLTDDAFPVGEAIRGDGGSFTVIMGYFNGTIGIKDPSLFDIPSSCTQTPNTNSGTNTMPLSRHELLQKKFSQPRS